MPVERPGDYLSRLTRRSEHIGAMLSRELLQQRLGFLEVDGIQPLAEPGIHLEQELAGGIGLPLLLPEATQTHGGSQLQGFRLLLARNPESLTETHFGCLLCLPRSALRLQQQFALETIQLGLPPSLCGCCHCGKGLGKDAESLVRLPDCAIPLREQREIVWESPFRVRTLERGEALAHLRHTRFALPLHHERPALDDRHPRQIVRKPLLCTQRPC